MANIKGFRKARDKARRKKIMILFYDDDQIYRDIMDIYYYDSEFVECKICKDFQQFIDDGLVNEEFDYAFIDWDLGEGDPNGGHVSKYINATEKFIVSGKYADQELHEFVKKYDMGFIAKPMRVNFINQIIGV